MERSRRSSDIRCWSWSESETRCLISIWAEDSVQRELHDSYRNRPIYEGIARKLEVNGYKRSWLQCQRKMKQLKLAYRKSKDNNSRPGRDKITCPFYDELDVVLRDRPWFCPLEEDVLDSADGDLSSCPDTTANATGQSVDNASASGENEDTTAAPASCASDRRKKGAARGTARRKKSRFEAILDAFTKALSNDKDDELMLKMQQAQHIHEEKLFGMMLQSIASLVSTQHPPGHFGYPPVHPPQPGPAFYNPVMATELQHTVDLPHCSTSVSPHPPVSPPQFQSDHTSQQ